MKTSHPWPLLDFRAFMRTRQQSFTSKYSQSAVLFLKTSRNSFHNLFSAALYIQLLEFNPSSMFWVCLRMFSQNTSRGRNLKDCTDAISHFNAEHQTFSKQPVDILPSPLNEFPPSFPTVCRVHEHRGGLGCWLTDNQPFRCLAKLSFSPPQLDRMAASLQTPHQSACWPYFMSLLQITLQLLNLEQQLHLAPTQEGHPALSSWTPWALKVLTFLTTTSVQTA